MAHDDESAEVEHVGYARSKAAGAYETRWDCCGRTVEGDGDLGPPSGWCYEGKHTMDRKRARYRNDSTPTNDLLQPCEARGCHRKEMARMKRRAPISEDARSTRSARSESDAQEQKPKKRVSRKRSQKALQDDEHEEEPGKGEQESSPKKKKRKVTKDS
ncbi:hypothetical protein K439DRAFT_326884 [Ramaria rubella]|nr:hypothetical protein K439DRAFT_326884 [Ramaria rubella]